MQKITAFLVGVFAVLATYAGVAYAQTYPSQPTFLKFGVGIGPNEPAATAEVGSPSPLGFGIIRNNTDGTGGFLGFLNREAGIDASTDFFSIGSGTNGGVGEFSVNAPWGTPLNFGAVAGGASGIVSIADSASTFELRGTRNFVNSNSPIFDLVELDAAANEKVTRFRSTAGLFEMLALTDALGAGTTLLTADRTGSQWQNVVWRVDAGTFDIGPTGSPVFTSTITQVEVAAGSQAAPGLAFILDPDTGLWRSGANVLSLAAGAVKVMDLTTTQIELAGDGSAAAPKVTWDGDLDMGLYRIGADNLGVSFAGAIAEDLAASYHRYAGDGTAAAPRISWTTDTNTGIYRVGADQLGISVGGTNVFTCTTGGCTGAGQSAAYGGWSDNAATAEDVPAGWSVSLAGNTFTWTHNLALAANTDLAVTVTPQVGSSEACRVNAIAANSFDVICYTTSTGSAANVAHFVTAIRN